MSITDAQARAAIYPVRVDHLAYEGVIVDPQYFSQYENDFLKGGHEVDYATTRRSAP